MIQVNKKDEQKEIKVLRQFWLVDTDGNKPKKEKAVVGKNYTLDADFCAEMVNSKKAKYTNGKKEVEVESSTKGSK